MRDGNRRCCRLTSFWPRQMHPRGVDRQSASQGAAAKVARREISCKLCVYPDTVITSTPKVIFIVAAAYWRDSRETIRHYLRVCPERQREKKMHAEILESPHAVGTMTSHLWRARPFLASHRMQLETWSSSQLWRNTYTKRWEWCRFEMRFWPS